MVQPSLMKGEAGSGQTGIRLRSMREKKAGCLWQKSRNLAGFVRLREPLEDWRNRPAFPGPSG